jgi:hypothetical protein
MGPDGTLPTLFVEGTDDVSVISALLGRHGVDTARGTQHLFIKAQESLQKLLRNMPDAIRNSTDRPVGFVVDIDIDLTHRWDAVCGKLRELELKAPARCPETGFFGHLPDYPHRFGIWLMPDCVTDGQKMEHLCRSLIERDDPLWPHLQASVERAAELVEEANQKSAEGERQWKRFKDKDRIGAQIYTWLAWKDEPGGPLGAAITCKALGHDSPQALAFLRWLKELYSFAQLAV